MSTDTFYKGYRVLSGTSDEINQAIDEIDINNWNTNEYLIIKNSDDNSVREMRFDGKQFVPLKLPPSKYIKAKNSLQRCALDILMNPDITVAAILGGYGTGKTRLAMSMALYHVREKGNQSAILGVREPVGEGQDIGFLPGSAEDKTNYFFAPLTQQLEGGEFELESLKQRGVIDTMIPRFMKGMTYNETIIVCDEAEDFSKGVLRLVGTRTGRNSRIFLAGDYRQSLTDHSLKNPLLMMCEAFKGDPRFGCIYMEEDVRSDTSKMFADLFQE